ncbi:MAG TPA: YozD family protein [Pseudoneobacillus sp.]|nr:YozD family protein [Pseudoneobacillus sp.]
MEDEFYVSTESLGNYFYKKLIAAGAAVDTGDLQLIADIAFDLLCDIGIIEDVTEDYEDEEE